MQDVLSNTEYPLNPVARQMLEQRREVGIREYGVPLHTHNGRDCLQDTAEELADALYYLLQAQLEGELGIDVLLTTTESLLVTVLARKNNRG